MALGHRRDAAGVGGYHATVSKVRARSLKALVEALIVRYNVVDADLAARMRRCARGRFYLDRREGYGVRRREMVRSVEELAGDVRELESMTGDRILVLSDGAYDQVADEEVRLSGTQASRDARAIRQQDQSHIYVPAGTVSVRDVNWAPGVEDVSVVREQAVDYDWSGVAVHDELTDTWYVCHRLALRDGRLRDEIVMHRGASDDDLQIALTSASRRAGERVNGLQVYRCADVSRARVLVGERDVVDLDG